MTVSHTPSTSKPGIFDFTGRAKWDSWYEVGKKYSTQSDPDGAAQERYLEIAKSLGWKSGATADDDLLGHESDGERENMKGVITGTGVFVSTMFAPKDEDLDTIHGLAIAGDAQTLEKMLTADPSLDLNQKDEYVSVFVSPHKPAPEACIGAGIHRSAPSVRQRELSDCRASPKTWGGPDVQGERPAHAPFAHMRLRLSDAGPGRTDGS